jgi:hypothetical protein
MESINVVIDDEEVGSLSKGEKPLSSPIESANPSADPVKTFSPQEQLVISSTAVPSQDPLETVPSGNIASAFEDVDPPKEPSSHVKLNHPSEQLLGDLNEGIRLRNRVVNPLDEVANQVTYSCYLA